MTLEAYEPFQVVQDVPSTYVSSYLSDLYPFDFWIHQVRISFELNAQRLLQIRVYVTGSSGFNSGVPPTGIRASGIPIIGSRGGQAYVVGDGEEGEIVIPVNRPFPKGNRICFEGYNTDPSDVHSIDARADISRILR